MLQSTQLDLEKTSPTPWCSVATTHGSLSFPIMITDYVIHDDSTVEAEECYAIELRLVDSQGCEAQTHTLHRYLSLMMIVTFCGLRS